MEAILPMAMAWLLTLILVWVMLSDITRYTISNKVNLTLLLLFVPFGLLMPETDWLRHALGFGAFFAGGFVLFALRAMGGGDVKLLAVLGLWCGWNMQAAFFAVYTGLYGGVLAVLLVIIRKLLTYIQIKCDKTWSLPRVLLIGQPIPYGVAIAAAFLTLLWGGELFL